MITNANLRFVAFGGPRQNVNQHQNIVVNVVAPPGTGRPQYTAEHQQSLGGGVGLESAANSDVTGVAVGTLCRRVD